MSMRPRVLFVESMDSYFLGHRLPLARAIQSAGAEVIVVAPNTGKAHSIQQAGFEFVSLPTSCRTRSLANELRAFLFLVRLYRRLNPDQFLCLVGRLARLSPSVSASYCAKLGAAATQRRACHSTGSAQARSSLAAASAIAVGVGGRHSSSTDDRAKRS